MIVNAVSMHQTSNPPFTVSGGVFSSPQQFGWHITNEKGFTVAVSCDSRFANWINDTTELLHLLVKFNCGYEIMEARDKGYIEGGYDEVNRIRRIIDDYAKEIEAAANQ
jgi:hypothetical protein